MILYLDTSALVKLYVSEAGTDQVRASVAAAQVVATCGVAYVEICAALARREREGSLLKREHAKLIKALDDDWQRIFALELNHALIHEAGAVAHRHALRAYDAVHLASCLFLQRQLGQDVLFACWDATLNHAATSAGLRTFSAT